MESFREAFLNHKDYDKGKISVRGDTAMYDRLMFARHIGQDKYWINVREFKIPILDSLIDLGISPMEIGWTAKSIKTSAGRTLYANRIYICTTKSDDIVYKRNELYEAFHSRSARNQDSNLVWVKDGEAFVYDEKIAWYTLEDTWQFNVVPDDAIHVLALQTLLPEHMWYDSNGNLYDYEKGITTQRCKTATISMSGLNTTILTFDNMTGVL